MPHLKEIFMGELKKYYEKKEEPKVEGHKELRDVLEHLFVYKYQWRRVGSSCIEGVKNPGDIDILVLDGAEEEPLAHWFYSKGDFYEGGSMPFDRKFWSFKNSPDMDWDKGEYTEQIINVIICPTKDYYDRFIEAQEICESSKLTKKEERIEVFDYMFDNPDGPTLERFTELVLRKVKNDSTGS